MKLLHSHPISACHDLPALLMPGVADPAPGLSSGEVDGITVWLAGQVQSDLWCALPHVDPDGQTSVMIMAPDDNPDVPTFVVHREDALLRLDVVQADTYTRLGAYGALTPLLGALTAAMLAARTGR